MARTIRQTGNFGRADGELSRGPLSPAAKSSDKKVPEDAAASAKSIDVKSDGAKSSHKARAKSGNSAKVSRSRDRLVLLSMVLVSTAIAAMLHLQFSLSVTTAALIGVGACAVFLLVNDQVRKSAEIAQLKAEISRLNGANPGSVPALDLRTIQSRLPNSSDRRFSDPERTDASYDPMVRIETRPMSQIDPQSVERSSYALAQIRELAGQDLNVALAHAIPSQTQNLPFDSGLTSPIKEEPLHRPILPAPTASEPLRDQWALRPRDTHEVKEPSSGVSHGGFEVGMAGPVTAPVSTIETDLALVQRKIKALADEVNATEVAKSASATLMSQAPPISASELESSIGALKTAADSMRHRPQKSLGQAPLSLSPEISMSPVPTTSAANAFGELVIPASAERIAVSGHAAMSRATAPSPHAPADHDLDFTLPLPPINEIASQPPINPRVAAITRAVETGRMDVLLSPIVGLMTHEVTHYDIKVRLKSETGAYFDCPEQDLVLAGSDVLALFDSARLTRAASLARRLDSRGKSGSLMSEVAGISLTDGGFLDTFAKIYEDRERIAGQLVLTFSQADVDRFSPSAWQALSDMHAFGFRFALDRLDHLDVDFTVLAKRGFAFAKLDAAVLLAGMPSRDRFVPVDEVCREIAGAGLTLIADAIDSEATRARLFGFGVLFGQGQLFGGGRLVSVDTSSGGRSVAA